MCTRIEISSPPVLETIFDSVLLSDSSRISRNQRASSHLPGSSEASLQMHWDRGIDLDETIGSTPTEKITEEDQGVVLPHPKGFVAVHY